MAKNSDDDESAAMSYLDVLGCGLGAALLLMVLFAIRLTGVIGTVAPKSSSPVVVMMDWDPGLPPTGLGSASVKLTMSPVSGGGAGDELGKQVVGVRTIGTVLDMDPIGGAASQRATRGLTLLPGKLAPGSEWLIRMELELKPPKEFNSTDKEFADFATRLEASLRGDTDVALLNEQASSYVEFVNRLMELRRNTATDEAAFLGKRSNEPSSKLRTGAFLSTAEFGQICRQRALRVKELFGTRPERKEVYPPLLYDKFFSNAKPRVLALDAELVRRSWLELSHPSSFAEADLFGQRKPEVKDRANLNVPAKQLPAMNEVPSRLRWVRTIQALSDPACKAPVRLRIDGPGLDGEVKTIEISNPLGQGGVRTIEVARLSVGTNGNVSVTYGKNSKLIKNKPITPPEMQETPRPPLWEIAQLIFDPQGVSETESVLTTIDKSLSWLEGQSNTPTQFDEYAGSGTEGLVLIAFIARGHGVGSPASEYGELTKKLADNLCERSLSNDGFIQGPAGGSSSVYHFGLGMTALERARADVSATNPDLESRYSLALDLVVDCALDKKPLRTPMFRRQEAGWIGWSYSEGVVDSSVSVVFAKALVDIAKRPNDSSTRRKAIAVIPKLHELFANKLRTSSHVIYSYHVGDAPSNDGLPARLPGCLLAEMASADPKALSDNAAWVKVFDAFVSKQIPSMKGEWDHYEMYYGGHLLMHCADNNVARKWLEQSSLHPQGKPKLDWDQVRREWFLKVRTKLQEIQVGGNQSLVPSDQASSSKALYRTAMGVVLLALPFERELSVVYSRSSPSRR